MKEILKQYFGYDSFREGQEKLIRAILDKNDVLGIMPTGAGKSMCFQLPALMQDGITIVISPLISLMKDQVGALIQAGVSTAYINSTLSPAQIDKALENAKMGKYKLIYVAPERLLTPEFIEFAKEANISMVTVDEAHCISQWGQDFRPSYARIPEFIAALQNRPVVSAFTATATKRVKDDIIEILSLEDPTVLVTGFNRENLYFEVSSPKNKMSALMEFLHKNSNKSGIVYCSTRKTVESVCDELNSQGFSSSRYHAGLKDAERHNNQDDFLFDRVQIMVATNAFGMGIDKSNVSFVVHFNMPKDIESYYQEAGRAGRDGNPAVCLLLYSGQDVRTSQWMIENSKDTAYVDEDTAQLLKNRDYKRLQEITFYSTTNDCLRAFILKYFGENPPSYCGDCSNCNTKFETVDITLDAQKILSCISRMKERFGIIMVIDVLRGSENERILELGLNNLSTYGISEKSVHNLRAIIEHLVQTGYLEKSEGQYSVLQLTSKSNEILYDKITVDMKLAKEKIKPEKRNSKATLPQDRELLYAKLRELRGTIAKEQNVPAYVVFSDNSLVDMCTRLPKTSSQFINVSGVGQKKLLQYGDIFIAEIIDFCSEFEIDEVIEIEEKLHNKKSKRTKQIKEIIFPRSDILQEIEIFEEPTKITTITSKINDILNLYECTTIKVSTVSNFLISLDLLEVAEKNKIPTIKGLDMGITREARTGSRGDYLINLYPPVVQKIIVDSICKILAIDNK